MPLPNTCTGQVLASMPMTRMRRNEASMIYRNKGASATSAIAAELQLSDSKAQEVTNTAWAFATANRRDDKLFAALTMAAERRLSDFKSQDVANTAWAFVKVNYRDEKLFATLAIAAGRRLREVSLRSIQMALWALLAT